MINKIKQWHHRRELILHLRNWSANLPHLHKLQYKKIVTELGPKDKWPSDVAELPTEVLERLVAITRDQLPRNNPQQTPQMQQPPQPCTGYPYPEHG